MSTAQKHPGTTKIFHNNKAKLTCIQNFRYKIIYCQAETSDFLSEESRILISTPFKLSSIKEKIHSELNLNPGSLEQSYNTEDHLILPCDALQDAD